MNIFHLSSNPRYCAEWLCDKHCVKMIVETGQMLSTAYQRHFGLQDDLYKPEPEWNNVEFYDEWKNIDDTYDKAEDGIHEGIDKHEKFAISLYNEIIDEL